MYMQVYTGLLESVKRNVNKYKSSLKKSVPHQTCKKSRGMFPALNQGRTRSQYWKNKPLTRQQTSLEEQKMSNFRSNELHK